MKIIIELPQVNSPLFFTPFLLVMYSLKQNKGKADSWSNEDIAVRWATLHKSPLLFQRWHTGDTLQLAELQTVTDMLTVCRKRLTSLSWFMECINEPIAKQATKEDKCTGHFFESRFKF